MANYKSQYTGAQIDEAVGKALDGGANGVTFTPSVDTDGNLSWTNDGGLENPETVNIKGPAGATGTTFTPSVDSSGNLSWSNDGGLTNPETVNIKGTQGHQGYGIVNLITGSIPEYTDADMEEMVHTQVDIGVENTSLRVGDTAICPYYNTDSFAYRIFGGTIMAFSMDNQTVIIQVTWYLN